MSTEQQLAERAAIQSLYLPDAVSAARRTAEKEMGPRLKFATVLIIERIAKDAFIAGIEAQSDALQSEFTAYERRIAQLEQRLAYMEQVRDRAKASAFLL